jgi:glycosyltransferase involved in cell wall biosynthesis
MKILHIHDRPFTIPVGEDDDSGDPAAPLGGLYTYLSGVARGSLARGWRLAEVRLAADAPAAGHCDGPHRYRVRLSRTVPRGSIAAALERIVETERPDLIQLHSPYCAANPLVVRRLARQRPVILTQHDVAPICFRQTKLLADGRACGRRVGLGCLTSGCYRPGVHAPLAHDLAHLALHPLQLAIYRRLPKIMVPSRYMREQLLLNRFDPARVAVAPLFCRYAAQEDVPPPHGNRILFVGRLVPEKGLEPLLAALEQLRAPDWRADIVGDGPMLPALRAAVAGRGLGERIILHGHRDADSLAAHYRAAAVVVMPSLIPESFGFVGVEAMAFGRPVVAFAAGGIGEWLADGVTGLTAPHGDAAALAVQLDRLLAAPDLQRQFGDAGRHAVRERFTLAAHMQHLDRIYRDVLA